MKTDSKIDRDGLFRQIALRYAMSGVALEFLPGKGEDSWCYKLNADGRLFFVKVHYRHDFDISNFGLLKELRDKGVEGILAPLAAKDGSASFQWDGSAVAIFPWLEGSEVRQGPVSHEDARRLGSLLASLHCSSSIRRPSAIETFEGTNSEGLSEVLEKIKAGPVADSQVEEFRQIFLPLVDRVRQEGKRFDEAGNRLKAANVPLVNTHGDSHTANIFRTTDGKFFMIDWDDFRCAPKERDLGHFKNADYFGALMEGYAKAGGDPEISDDAMAYYGLKWNVGEAADLGRRMMFEDQDSESKRHYIKELDHFFNYSGLRS